MTTMCSGSSKGALDPCGEGFLADNRCAIDYHPAWHGQVREEKRPDPITGQGVVPPLAPDMDAEVLAHHRHHEMSIEEIAVAVEHPALGQLPPPAQVGLDPPDEVIVRAQPAAGTSVTSTPVGLRGGADAEITQKAPCCRFQSSRICSATGLAV